MEIVEVDNVLKIIMKSRLIGYGTTSFCFLMPDGNVLKLYRNTYNKVKLFQSREINEHLQLLNSLNNFSYVGPNKIYTHNGNIIGYSLDYVKSKELCNINAKIKINDLLKELPRLIEDTYLISEKKFALGDLHDRNILYELVFKIIDLDFGFINDNSSIQVIAKSNISYVLRIIVNSLFDVKENENMKFYSFKINELYNKMIYTNYEYGYDFFETISEELKIKDLTVAQLKRKKSLLREKIENSYFNNYLI